MRPFSIAAFELVALCSCPAAIAKYVALRNSHLYVVIGNSYNFLSITAGERIEVYFRKSPPLCIRLPTAHSADRLYAECVYPCRARDDSRRERHFGRRHYASQQKRTRARRALFILLYLNLLFLSLFSWNNETLGPFCTRWRSSPRSRVKNVAFRTHLFTMSLLLNTRCFLPLRANV